MLSVLILKSLLVMVFYGTVRFVLYLLSFYVQLALMSCASLLRSSSRFQQSRPRPCLLPGQLVFLRLMSSSDATINARFLGYNPMLVSLVTIHIRSFAFR